MPLEVTISNGDEVLAKFDAMIRRIEVSGDILARQLVHWQREDMNRKYPNITIVDQYTCFTRVWPRSRLAMQPGYKAPPTLTRAKRVRTFNIGGVKATKKFSFRPILRIVLVDMLHARMKAVGEQIMDWNWSGPEQV
jgi:hypothetical protein